MLGQVSPTFPYVEIANKMDIPLRNVMGHEKKDLRIIIIIKEIIPEIIVPNWFYYLMIII
jgi:hypothetical protein